MHDPDAPTTEPGGVRMLPPRPPQAPPGTGADEPPDDRNTALRAGRRWVGCGLALQFGGAALVLANLLAAQGSWRVLGLLGLGLVLTFMLATIVLAAARRDLLEASAPAVTFGLALLLGILFLLLGMWGGPNPLKLHGAVGLACFALAVPVLRAGLRRYRAARRPDVPFEDDEPLWPAD